MSRSAAWRIIPRPFLETILNNHAHHHRVPNLLLLHGPRGVGKSSLLLHRLLPEWNKGPHLTAFIDFSPSPSPSPWISLTPSPFLPLKSLLEKQLESLTHRAILLGAISSHNVFKTLTKYHSLCTTLRRLTNKEASNSKLWHKAVYDRIGLAKIDIGAPIGGSEKKYEIGEVAYVKEAVAALRVAKEVIEMQQEWRKEAVRNLNRKGGFSRSLVNSATDWACLLVELLSEAAEIDFFQVWG